MIKERLKELDIKITELANYLQISRPTMYKFIENYDNGLIKEVNPNVKKLFDYIEKNELVGKRNVINFILTKMTDTKELEDGETSSLVKGVKDYVSANPNAEKTHFISSIVDSVKYDLGIHFLVQVMPLLNKKKPLTEEQKMIDIYNEIVDLYSKE